MKKKDFFKFLCLCLIIILMIPSIVVYIFDPFFHYHKPIRPLKAVLTQAEYQVIGTLKNFDYNAVIAGSSMAENYNNKWFDELYGCTSVKAVKPGANTSDLIYLLDRAFNEKEINYVFYTLDISALTTTVKEHYVNEGMPLYLYNENPFDDVKYLWNKHVLFEDIPYMIASSLLDDYDEGNSYNWAKYKEFGKLHYTPTLEKAEDKKLNEYRHYVDNNLDKIENLVTKEKNTEFIFMIPPYSSLWWYEAYMCGDLEYDFYALEQVIERLSDEENVSIHFFQSMEEIVTDLSLYMDLLHYHPDINKKIVEMTASGEKKVTEKNKDEVIMEMRLLADRCINQYAKDYINQVQGD